MSLRIPKNQISEKKYTNGDSLVFKNTGLLYTGYYTEYKGKIYQFDSNIELELKENNILYKSIMNKDNNVYLFNKKKNIKQDNINPISVRDDISFSTRYFVRKKTDKIIKEVNRQDYQKVRSNALFTVISIDFSRLNLEDELKKLNDKGIIHAIRSQEDLEEASGAYKNIDQVMKQQSDLVEILVKLEPLAVIKG
jgi:tRNA-splicing ligase RtcB